VAILAQSSADFALTYNFQGSHILGASRSHLCDSVIFLLLFLFGGFYRFTSLEIYGGNDEQGLAWSSALLQPSPR